MGLRKKRLLVAPTVTDSYTLLSLMARLAHYVAHLDVRRLTIPVTAGLRESAEWLLDAEPPLGVDPAAVGRISQIIDRTSFVAAQDEIDVAARSSDVMAFWNVTERTNEPWRSIAGLFRVGRTCFDIDWRHTRTDGRGFADISALWASEPRRFDAEEDRFRSRTGSLAASPAAYLVGTGPSARSVLDLDLDDAVRIVCNTTILDDELMAHVRPHIVTFADPIFHFGPSTYSYAFRRALSEQAAIHDFTVVTLEHFAELLRSHLPALSDRVIGVRLGKPWWPQNYDLIRHLAVKPYPNILTMLMLPLAATFSRTIRLIGFDGRDPSEKYFWRHGKTVQLERELADIRHAHPGFFELDYADYYNTHVAALEQMCLDIELRGGVIQPLSPSAMIPLRRRPPSTVRSACDQRSIAAPLIVSVTPDWTSDFGHFGPWERAVRSAARASGYQYRSLASRALADHEHWVLPTFTHGTVDREGARVEQFERDLRDGLDHMDGTADHMIVCFYVASVWHLPTLLEVAQQRPNTTFVVNLMRSHRQIVHGDDQRTNIPLQLLAECLDVAAGTNVHVCLDTEAAIGDLQQATGRSALLWPIVMVADPVRLWQASRDVSDRPVHLVAPVQAQSAKGFPLLAGLAERFRHSLHTGSVALTARSAPQPTGNEASTPLQAAAIKSFGGVLIDEHLTDLQYAALVGSAHVVVVPYALDYFRTRTSGVVLDAIAAGKPVVTTRGTWAGDLVEHHGVGRTFEDGDLDSFEFAVRRVIGDLDSLTRSAEKTRSKIIADFSPGRLVSFLAGLAAADNPPPNPLQIAGLRRCAEIGVVGHWLDRVRRDDERLEQLIRQDDVERSYDKAHDYIAVLEIDAEHRRRAINRLKGATKTSSTTPSASAIREAARTPTQAVPSDISNAIYVRSDGAHLDELSLVSVLLEPGAKPGVMIDVGAHRGSSFRPFHKAGWTIHAFEPDPRHAAFLADTYGLDARIRFDDRAVSNVTGEKVPFYVSAESTGISGLSAFRDSHVAIGHVETVALRDVVDTDRVDLLKIDTEGHEKFVLEGFPWERLRPNVIIAEFENTKTRPLGYDTEELVRILRDRGYQVWVSEWHPIVRYGIQHQWHRLVNSEEHRPDENSWGNLIAFREPVSSDTMGRALVTVLRFEPTT